MPDDKVRTTGEVAAELGLSSATVRNWVTSRRLPGWKDPDDPRRWLVYQRDVEAFLHESSGQGIGRPKPRGVTTEIEHDDWSEAPDEATLNLVNPRRPESGADGAVVSLKTALAQIEKSDISWEQAIHGFEEYPARLRALAEAADMRSRTMMAAHLAGLTTYARPGTSKLPGLAPILTPGRNRPGPPDLWKQFDKTVKQLLAAVEGGSLPVLSAAFAGLAPIAAELADACEQDGSGLERAV